MQENNRRHRQVANRIREELVNIANHEISDPRLAQVGMVTFSGVDLSPDLRDATVWVSFMGKEEKDPAVKDAMKALASASGFIHRLLIKRIPMKVHPRVYFRYDNMFERAAIVGQALSEAAEVEQETSRVRATQEPDPQEDE